MINRNETVRKNVGGRRGGKMIQFSLNENIFIEAKHIYIYIYMEKCTANKIIYYILWMP